MLVETLSGQEDYAWTPSGSIVMGSGAVLYEWSEGGEWTSVADLSTAGVEGITRLAVSPKGDRIAFVGVRPAAPVRQISMPAPEGWRSETIPFPLEFAPDLVYEGIEEIQIRSGRVRRAKPPPVPQGEPREIVGPGH